MLGTPRSRVELSPVATQVDNTAGRALAMLWKGYYSFPLIVRCDDLLNFPPLVGASHRLASYAAADGKWGI